MDIPDIVSEIINNLTVSSLLNFHQTNKLIYDLSYKYIKKVDEDQFIEEHKFKIINKTYETYIPINILKYDDISKIPGFKIHYNGRLSARYQKDHIYVFLLKTVTRIKITNCESTKDANKKLNNILLMLFSCVPDYKLAHISTTLKINKYQYNEHYLSYIANYTMRGRGRIEREYVRPNNKIKGINYLLDINGGIVVTYEKFLTFFLTYMRYIK